jgi:hypothetical protein
LLTYRSHRSASSRSASSGRENVEGRRFPFSWITTTERYAGRADPALRSYHSTGPIMFMSMGTWTFRNVISDLVTGKWLPA